MMRKFPGLALAIWLLLMTTPGAARAEDPLAAARQRAVAWLHTQQLPDGGFGLRGPDGSGASNASATADAVYDLALAGEQPDGPAWTVNGHTPLAALAALAPAYVGDDAGQAGKVARAVSLAGQDPRHFGGLDLIATIQAAYDPASGRYHPDLAFRHTLAVEALLRAGEPVPPAAWDALLQAQRPAGGWFWAFSGGDSDVDSTGRVLQLLARAGLRCGPQLDPAAAYLAGMQDAAGGWGVGNLPGPPNANSTALAVAGLRAAGYDVTAAPFTRAGRSALDSLLAFQQADGGFVYIPQPGREESRLMATLDALNALSQTPLSQTPLSQTPAAGAACRLLYLPVRLIHG